MLPFLLIATSSAQTCVDVVLKSAEHKTLASLATTAGGAPFVATLNSVKPLTIFAPTDAAIGKFKAANPELFKRLEDVKELRDAFVGYHFISGAAFDPAKAEKKNFVKATNGGVLSATVDGSSVTLAFGLGTSKVTSSIKCSNGIVHVVDTVLVPPPSASATAVAAKLTRLVAALSKAKLVETVDGAKDVTIFAPTDNAFEDLAAYAYNNKLALTDELLSQVLQLHVVPGVFYSTKVPSKKTAVPSLLKNQTVSVQARNGKVLVAGGGQDKPAYVVTADVLFNNGVIHVIDQVLLPDLKKPSPPNDKDYETEKPILDKDHETEKPILYNSGVGLGMACSMLIALLQ
jgi:transforming growth factor-beta-induced protein